LINLIKTKFAEKDQQKHYFAENNIKIQ